MSLLTELLKVLLSVSLCSGLCQDIDTKACETMVKHNPGLCNDQTLAMTACPKFCGKCSSLLCYHCDTSVNNFLDCNTTKTCELGERCILHELTSSRDGHHEYRMNCASLDMCDSTGTLFGRRDLESRDIRTHCCTDDMCNYPIALTPTTAPPITSCSRDIEILIQDSADSLWIAHVIDFLNNLISRVAIGPLDNQVGVAILDGGIHRQFKLDEYTDQLDLLQAVNSISFHYNTGEIRSDDIKHFLNNELQSHRPHGEDRLGYKDSVILIAQHYAPHLGPLHVHHDTIKADLSSVIVMQVGPGILGDLTTLATDSRHIIDVPDHNALSQQVSRVLNLLCV